jgi:DNA/RNA-binding domain of Phe-tRNA-synthetase-like protein
MVKIQFDDHLKNLFPKLRLGILSAVVKMKSLDDELEELKKTILQNTLDTYKIDDIQNILTIEESRTAYKMLGKEPSRYRPSAEALLRRIIGGKGLYSINNVVDLINLVSVQSGFSIGGYNHHLIKGSINLSVGLAGEDYDAIGRGHLNIENLPLLRDEISAFGSPTSDSERTKICMDTKNCLWVFFDFYSNDALENALKLSSAYLKDYAGATELILETISVNEMK